MNDIIKRLDAFMEKIKFINIDDKKIEIKRLNWKLIDWIDEFKILEKKFTKLTEKFSYVSN
jgi:hypothetical protein